MTLPKNKTLVTKSNPALMTALGAIGVRETATWFRTILDNLGVGVSVIDGEYRILWVNQGIPSLYDKNDSSNLLGKKCFAEYHGKEGFCDNCPARTTFEQGMPSQMTKIVKHIGKGRIVLDISTFPIKNSVGKVIEVIEITRNVSGAVKLEDRLLYQERLAGIGELAAGVAHEIRNPLGNIVASTQLCLGKYSLHKQAKKYLKIVLKNAEHADRIIRDLLDFAKPREGFNFMPGHLGRVVESACNLVRARCMKQHVRLSCKCSRTLPEILMDEKRLTEAFLNFILNALDAMPNSGKLLINASPDSQAHEAQISFLDTGEGISHENLNKLFTPFFSTKKRGVGLGLCLAQQVVAGHKGRIELKSQPGKGTEVIVRLPLLVSPFATVETNGRMKPCR